MEELTSSSIERGCVNFRIVGANEVKKKRHACTPIFEVNISKADHVDIVGDEHLLVVARESSF